MLRQAVGEVAGEPGLVGVPGALGGLVDQKIGGVVEEWVGKQLCAVLPHAHHLPRGEVADGG